MAFSSNNNYDKPNGIHGIQAFTFVGILIVLLLISLLTTITSIVIIYKLNLFPRMELVGFNQAHEIIFHENTDLNKVYLHKNILEDVSKISGDVSLISGKSYLKLDNSGIEFKSPEGLKVYSSKGKLLFPPDFSKISLPTIPSLSIPGGTKDVRMIRSPTHQDLKIYGKENVFITGNEGVSIQSKNIYLQGDSINITSIDSSIVLEAEKAISLNMNLIPLATEASKSFEYKLCICGKNGRIFKIKIKDENHGCADVKFPDSINPCI